MKIFIFSALAMAVMASCTNSSIDEVVNNDEPVAIQLNAGVKMNTVVSRAAITTGQTFVATILGWEGTEAPTDYTTLTPWASTTNTIDGAAENAPLTITPLQYYSANEGTKTFMKGYYPSEGTVTAGVYSFKSGYFTDGTQDVLISNLVTGNKKDASVKLFTFTHPLAQLKFALKAGVGMGASVKVKSIELKSVQLPKGITLGTSDAVLYDDAKALSVPGVTDADGIAPSSSEDGASFGNPVMVCPLGTNALNVKVVTNEATYDNILIKIEGDNIVAGTAYTITLTFQNKAVAGNATVTDWKNGTGSGTVE